MNNGNELKQEIFQLKEEKNDIEASQEQTRLSILRAIYIDESFFGKVLSIIKGKKINPSYLVDSLSSAREEFKKEELEKLDASNDEEFEKIA